MNRPVRLPTAITSRVAPAKQLKLAHLALVAVGLIVLVALLALGGGAIERVLRGDTATVEASDASSTSLAAPVAGSDDEPTETAASDPSTGPTDSTDSTDPTGSTAGEDLGACAAADLLGASQPLVELPLAVVSKQCEGPYAVARLVTVPPTPDIPARPVWVAFRGDGAGWHPLASGYVGDETTWALYCMNVQQTVDPSFVTTLCR